MKKTAQNIIKKIAYLILINPLRWYLSKTRKVKIGDITLEIPPSVFHPSFYFSTDFLLEYLDNEDFVNKRVLELGAGSGLLSVFMAKNKANVFASDINLAACEAVIKNANANDVYLHVIHSDLFDNFPKTVFDLIIINPPYYPKYPQNDTENAFFCGGNFEYFHKLFSQVANFLTENGKIIMVLSEDCEIKKIREIAENNQLNWSKIQSKKIVGELNILFEIRK